MSAQRHYTGLTYSEVREWAVILNTFTAGDLALEIGVDYDTGVRCVNALVMHGICRDTGDKLDGRHGYEAVIQYIELPAGPRTHETGPDPVQQAIAQAGRISVPRGEAVRIRTSRQMRRSLSTPGAMQFHKNRQREWEKQQEAKTKRAAEQQAKSKADEPAWRRKKK